MSLRLIETVIPRALSGEVDAALGDGPVVDRWSSTIDGERVRVSVLVEAGHSEALVDRLEQSFRHAEGFRLLLLPVEAALPRPSKPAPTERSPKATTRISREELYADIEAHCRLSRVFVVLVILSSTVAAIGLLRSSVALIIGAMVIAPLLGPNAALALATTLGDLSLARRALRSNLVGVVVAFVFALLVGWGFQVDPALPEIAARTEVGLADIALALASGAAGALAFTAGAPTSLIGVMVAVALLPPLAVVGMLLGAGYPGAAWGAFLLLATNVTCVNLAGVASFLAQGIRPRAFWEASRARRASWVALALWTLAVALLAGLIVLAQQR